MYQVGISYTDVARQMTQDLGVRLQSSIRRRVISPDPYTEEGFDEGIPPLEDLPEVADPTS